MSYSQFHTDKYTGLTIPTHDATIIGFTQINSTEFGALSKDGHLTIIDLDGDIRGRLEIFSEYHIDHFCNIDSGFATATGANLYLYNNKGNQVGENHFDNEITSIAFFDGKLAVSFWNEKGWIEIIDIGGKVQYKSQVYKEKIVSLHGYNYKNNQFLIGCSKKAVYRFGLGESIFNLLSKDETIDESTFKQVWYDGRYLIIDNLGSISKPTATYEKALKNTIFFRRPSYGFNVFHAEDDFVVFGGKGLIKFLSLSEKKSTCFDIKSDSDVSAVRRFGNSIILFGTSCGTSNIIDTRPNSQKFIMEK